MRRLTIILLLGWVLGIGTALGALIVTDAWYEYQTALIVPDSRNPDRALLAQGWQVDRLFGPTTTSQSFADRACTPTRWVA
jgi:hypothetical protein